MTEQKIAELEREISRLELENAQLRRVIAIHQRQLKSFPTQSDRERRLRNKLAEWENGMTRMNGGYYHGSRFILPFIDYEGLDDA